LDSQLGNIDAIATHIHGKTSFIQYSNIVAELLSRISSTIGLQSSTSNPEVAAPVVSKTMFLALH